MKKITTYCLALLLALICGGLAACSDFEPKGLPEVPELLKASDLKASVDGYNVNLTWNLPAADDIEGVMLLTNGGNSKTLEGRATSYTVVGQPMQEEYLYTVKVMYAGDYVSEGVSCTATIPYIELPDVTALHLNLSGRTVSLDWTLPVAENITGVKVTRNGNEASATLLEPTATSCVLKNQPMDTELTYTVSVVYDTYYASPGVSARTTIPYVPAKVAYLMTASSIQSLPDDDERAAAAWFVNQPNTELIWPARLADIDPELYPVIWIMIDRVGLPVGWTNLPSEISNDATIAALRAYTEKGGNLYLSNMATQLTVPLGYVPDNMAPTVYGNGDGGSGDDVWVLNAYLGWDFRNGSDQGFYDRTGHAIYKGLSFEDPNNYGYNNLPLIGPGQREDHNCLWDCNIYGKGDYPDVIKNFEMTTNSLVLATWGHVRDHCVAAIVDFNSTSTRGRCVANGLAAYEWNQNSGVNPYQHNIEQLTTNILDYLK